MKLTHVSLALLLGLFSSVLALADDFESKTSTNDWMDKAYVNYSALYHGAALDRLDSAQGVDAAGNPSKGKINLDGELIAGYRVTKDIGVGPYMPFLLFPEGQGFVIGDVGVKAFDKKTFTTEDLTVSTNLMLQAPTSDASRARNMKYGIKTTPSFRYNIGETKFTVGSFSEAKYYAGVTYDKEVKLLAEPFVAYSLSRSFALNLAYEMEFHHNVGQKAFKFGNYQKDLQPGVVWIINKNVFVNPYLQVFTTHSSISWKTTAVGAFVNVAAL